MPSIRNDRAGLSKTGSNRAYGQLSSSNFADDTTVIGLITDNDETAYREEVSTLTKWCQENHLSLNIDKTKELVVDYRRQSREHTTITHRQDTCGAGEQL